jgi:uncharacterized protein (TIGR02246 family)
MFATGMLTTLGILVAGQVAPAQVPAAPARAAAPAQPAATAQPAVPPDQKAIQDTFQAMVAAYNARDPQAMAALFDEAAVLVDSEGQRTEGREAILGQYSAGFQEAPTAYQAASVLDSVQFVTPDVARVEGTTTLTADKEATIKLGFSALGVKRAEGWRIAELRDYPLPPEAVSPADQLAQLEWMVGEWVDQSDQGEVASTIRWANPQKTYLVRTYTVNLNGEPASSGLMVIGWDPTTGQIKSWVFSGEGGHGEGLWVRASDNQWIVKAEGTMADGSPTSATQVITLENNDVVKTSSIDRIIGGEIAPDVADLVMVRKPPAPAGAAPAGPAAAPAPAAPATRAPAGSATPAR